MQIMRRLRKTCWLPRICVLAVVGMCMTALAEPAATNQSLRLILTLADGSRVVGVPKIQSVPLQTEYLLTYPLATKVARPLRGRAGRGTG